MLAGSGGGEDLGHVDGVFFGLGRVADGAAGEQPHRPAGQGGVTCDQHPGWLRPMAGVHGAAHHHHRAVAVDLLDLLGREHRGFQAVLAQRLGDRLGDLGWSRHTWSPP
jgi:hypothetical protein